MKRKGFWSIVAASLVLAAVALVTGCADAGDDGGTYVANNGGGGGVTGGGTGGVRSVKINAMTQNNLAIFGSEPSRALVPSSRTPYPDTDAGDYKFYLCYSNDTDSQVQEVTLTGVNGDPMRGTYKIKLQTDVYHMTLYGVEKNKATAAHLTPSIPAPPSGTTASTEADILDLAALRSYAVVDMRYQDEASFLLTPNGLTGKGDYELTIVPETGFTVPDSTQYTITAALYPYEGNVNTAASPVRKLTESGGAFDTTADSDGVPGNVLKGKIDCGTYTLKVLFTPAGGGKAISCTETITIMANLETKDTFEVSIDQNSGTPPNAPQQFIAGYTAPTGSKSEVYTVEFAWVDTSDNEDGFEIDLMRVDDPTDARNPTKFPKMPTSEDTWSGATNGLKGTYAKDADKVFDATTYTDSKSSLKGVFAWRDQGPEAVELITLNCENLPSFMASMAGVNTAGSLGPNSKNLKIELPLGHRYVARIRAVSYAGGASPYTYLKLPLGTNSDPLATTAITTSTALTAYDDKGTAIPYKADPKAATNSTGGFTLTANTPFGAEVETLNLFRISYNVLGGTFKDATTEQPPVPDPVLLSFHSEHTVGNGASSTNVKLLTPDSKIEDTAAGVTAVTGVVNNAEMLGAALPNNSSGIRLELMSAADTYWNCWLYGDATADPTVAANHYPQNISSTSNRENNLYTGYDNLDLVASYEAGGDSMLTGDIVLNLINRYALEPGYVTMKLYAKDGTASKYSVQTNPSAAASDPDDFKDGAKLDDFIRTKSIEVKRGTAQNEVDAMEFSVSGPAATSSGTGTGTGGSGSGTGTGTGGSGSGTGGGATGSGGSSSTPTTPSTGSSTTTPTKTTFSYDKIKVEVYSTTGSFYVSKMSTNKDSAKTVKFQLPPDKGNYKVHIYGYKGSYVLEMQKQLRITVK